MTQAVFPEVQAVADALQRRISLTESEIAPLKEIVEAKEYQIREWRGLIETLVPTENSQQQDEFEFFI